MSTILGTVKNGQVILDQPSVLAEGTRVEINSIDQNRPTLGLREEDWPTTPEGIAELLKRMDQIRPDWLSPDDDLTWREALRAKGAGQSDIC